MRLDNVLATVLNLSRSNALKLIASGKVKLNYRQIEKANQTVMIGDMISVRGFGRFRLGQQEGISKSGKAKVVIDSLLRLQKQVFNLKASEMLMKLEEICNDNYSS